MNLTSIAMLNTKHAAYWHIISRISKSETIDLLKNVNLTEKLDQYKISTYLFIYLFIYLLYKAFIFTYKFE